MKPALSVPAPTLDVEIGGQTLTLLGEGAIYWHEQRALVVADLHLGKGATFRAAGIPVPHGPTRQTLGRLTLIMRQYRPAHVLLLGDLVHGAQAFQSPALPILQAWRREHADVRCVLVRGNHDRHALPPRELDIEVVEEPWSLGGLALCHDPATRSAQPQLAGHVHPVAVVRGLGRDRMRLPCFVRHHNVLTLPAFGEFTGGFEIEPAEVDACYVIADACVWRMPVLPMRRGQPE
jgi:DNA ligase-associated metallophosphoesterase